MAEIMQAIFDPLVQCVYDHGGFVSSFAGDGFTALFPGKRTQIMGLTAAARMRKHIIEHSTRTTPFGVLHFAIKIGMAEGDVDWGIIGGGDQALHACYFGGKAIEECAKAERRAGVNELVVNEPVMERLKSMVGVISQDGYWRITDIYTPLPPPKPASQPDLPSDLTAAFVPSTVLQKNVRGEYRQVLTLFVKLREVRTWEQLNAIGQEVFDLQSRYGGYLSTTDVDDMGCRLLLFWGMPVGFENDLECALNFVLDLSARTGAALKAGATYQLAYAGFVGRAGLRQAYTCYGQGVNLAARLMSSASWGGIWLDEQVAQRARHRFVLNFRGLDEFKGFEGKQPVHELVGRREGGTDVLQASMAGQEQKLVGREWEQARLKRFLAPVLAGRFAGTMLICGEAGVGKSRLVHELRHQSVTHDPNPRWFLCQPDRIGRHSLNPFRYFLRRYSGQTPTRSAKENLLRLQQKVAELASQTSNAVLQRKLEQSRPFLETLSNLHGTGFLHAQMQVQDLLTDTMEALKALIVAESLCQPIVLHVEDAHRLDEDSIRFLQYLARGVEDCPMAIVLTARPELEIEALGIEGPFSVMELGPLGRQELETLADLTLGSVPSDNMVTLLLQRSGGNPFFAEQMLLHLREEGEIDNVDRYGQTSSLLPFNVRTLLTARLDRLPSAVKDAVQGAAVLGQEFDEQVLTFMFQNDVLLAKHVREAEGAAIWVPVGQGRFRFRSGLLREAAYDMLPQARRRRLHRLAAEALEIMHAVDLAQSYNRLAYHYGRAEDEAKERHYAILAGDQAEAQFAHVQAADLYSRALALTERGDRNAQYDLLCRRERVYDLLGEREAQLQDLELLAELAEDLADDYKRAEVALRQGRYAEVTRS